MYGDLKIRQSAYSTRYQKNPSHVLEETAQANEGALDDATTDLPQTAGIHGGPVTTASPTACSTAFALSRPPGRWLPRPGTPQVQQRVSDVPLPEQGQSLSSPCGSSYVWETQGTLSAWQTTNVHRSAPSATPGSSTVHSCRASHIQRTVKNALEKRVFEFYLDHAGPWVSNLEYGK